jgi:glycosyltransferase involved in cell wall biosynthesis
VIGPEPPPATGMELATRALMNELRRATIPFIRVNTADPTDELGNRGHWTFHNGGLAFRHLLQAVRQTFRRDVAAVYLPIAQAFPGLARDLLFVIVARLARKPFAIHLHGGSFGTYYQSQNAVARHVIAGVLRDAALGIVLTEQLRPALECVIPADRIAVVQNGLDLPKSERPARSRATSDTVDVLFLSTLYPAKGVYVFIEAIAEARKSRPQLRGVVAGQWPSEEIHREALALVETLALEDAIKFVGPVEGGAKTDLLNEVDIFCFPSFYPLEGQPLVIIEAMAARLPVVATSWRGISETVIDQETGFLVDEPSPTLVAEKLTHLIDHPEVRERLGRAGRARYEDLYTQRAFGERMVRVLQPLLHGRGRNQSPAPERSHT